MLTSQIMKIHLIFFLKKSGRSIFLSAVGNSFLSCSVWVNLLFFRNMENREDILWGERGENQRLVLSWVLHTVLSLFIHYITVISVLHLPPFQVSFKGLYFSILITSMI